jgi:hypothetical protein
VEEIVLEENNMSTPEFIAEAAAAGFSLKELKQAEQELYSSQVSLNQTIHDRLQRRLYPARPKEVGEPTMEGSIASAKGFSSKNVGGCHSFGKEDQWNQFSAAKQGTGAVSEGQRSLFCTQQWGIHETGSMAFTDSVLPLAGEFRRR